MKRYSQIAILMLLLLCVLLCTVACGSSKVTEISVDSRHMPQTVFVVGGDLDLSKGTLKVQTKKGTTEVSMDSAEITVSGYDKDTLGKQEITIAYQGQTTKLSVTVVPRIQVENYEANYFVGDVINKNIGMLTITKDDGSAIHVALNDATVSVEGFDTSKAAESLPLTVRYKTDAVDYTGNFAVQVHGFEGAVFTQPSQTEYKSHESELNLRGGYLTAKTPDGKNTKSVALTADMVTGFDPELATAANRTEPLIQTIQVNYAGTQYSYTVRIFYTDVTDVHKAADALSVLDWEGAKLPEVPVDLGEVAVNALQVYQNLTKSDQNLITEEERELLIRTAVVYSYAKWNEELASVSASVVPEKGAFVLVADPTLEQYRADYTKLNDPNNTFYTWNEKVIALMDRYADFKMNEETTVADYLAALVDATKVAPCVESMGYALALYEKVNALPFGQDVTVDEAYLEEHDETLVDILDLIKETNVSAVAVMMENVVTWCDGDFSNLCQALYDCSFAHEDAAAANQLKNYAFPVMFNSLVENLSQTWTFYQTLMQGQMVDSTYFLYSYQISRSYANYIKNQTSPLNQWLYQVYTFDGFAQVPVTAETVLNYMKAYSSHGYLYFVSPILDNENCTILYNAYMNYLNSDELGEDFIALLYQVYAMELTPAEQMTFIRMLHPFYTQAPKLAFDMSAEANTLSIFVKLAKNYYQSNLSESGYAVFCNLSLAMESYIRYCAGVTDSRNDFLRLMNSVSQAYDSLTEKDKELLGALYEQYTSIRTTCFDSAGEPIFADWGDWKETFDELKKNLTLVNQAGQAYLGGQQRVYDAYIAVYLANVENLVGYIMGNAPDEVLIAYFYQVDSDYGVPLATVVDSYHGMYLTCLVMMGMDEEAPDFAETDLAAFLMLYSDVLVNGADNETLTQLLKAYYALTGEDTELFLRMERYSGNVFNALTVNYFQKLLAEDKKNLDTDNMTDEELNALTEKYNNVFGVMQQLTVVQSEYAYYKSTPDGFTTDADGNVTSTYLEDFQVSVQKLQQMYNALSADEQALFKTYAEELYGIYLNAYQATLTPAEDAA